MSEEGTEQALKIIGKHQRVFGNDIPGYNGAKGKFEASHLKKDQLLVDHRSQYITKNTLIFSNKNVILSTPEAAFRPSASSENNLLLLTTHSWS